MVQKQEFLSRWIEIIKKSSAVLVYKQDFASRFLAAVRSCATRHTYDLAWARALVETAGGLDAGPGPGGSEITLRTTAARMIKYYWNQTVFFGLIQGSNPCSQPELMRRVHELIAAYYENRRPRDPVRFDQASFSPRLKQKLADNIEAACDILKNDVVTGFLGKGGLEGEFIDYRRGGDTLVLPRDTLAAIREYSPLITEVIFHRWALILERYNSSPRINKKVRIIEETELRDRPLSFYSRYLDLENPGRLCFLCGQPAAEEDLNITHVIPWSYLCSDDIWNLVYTHKGCRISETGTVPSEFVIARLEKRNRTLLKILSSNVETDMVAGSLQYAADRNVVRKHWANCQ